MRIILNTPTGLRGGQAKRAAFAHRARCVRGWYARTTPPLSSIFGREYTGVWIDEGTDLRADTVLKPEPGTESIFYGLTNDAFAAFVE